MTTRAEIEALIKRLEEAKEGSREIDYSIRMVLAGFAPVSAQAAAYSDEYESFDHAPHYTTSVDAALSLVPEGWFYSVSSDYGHANVHKKRGGAGGAWTHNAPTVALALCIASLRSRLSSMKDDANG